jgi:hypothetical protein
MQDVIRSDGSDKRFHDHGQSESEFAEVIKRLSVEGSTVLDPFVGGGSVAAAEGSMEIRARALAARRISRTPNAGRFGTRCLAIRERERIQGDPS